MDDTLVVKQSKPRDKSLSCEYIRGLVEGEGCFSFCPGSTNKLTGNKYKIPTFIISMHERDEELLNLVKNTLGLKNKVYNFKSSQKDGHKRGRKAMLIIRDFRQLKDIIIPLFHNKLIGNKGNQFVGWMERIGSDPDISDRFKSLYRLYKWGAYDNNPKFTEKYKD